MYRSFFGHLCKSFSVILPAASVSSHINSHLCFGLSIHFSRELEIDIIHDPLFKRANEVFHAVTVDMKRKGLAKVDHTPPIEPEDLKQMYCSVALNPNTPIGLQQKMWFDVMFFLCRH
jgi:hypothetical protein